MFELVIFNLDGSVHWTEHFNSMVQAQHWLAEEQTRPYWNPKYTTTITDKTPIPNPQDAIDQANLKAAIIALATRLQALDDQTSLTTADQLEQLRKTLKLLRLKGLLSTNL